MCIPMFTEALFTKQTKYGCTLSTHKQINRYRRCGIYTYNEIYYSAIKNKEALLLVTWMYIEDIMLIEINQRERDKYYMFYLYVESKKIRTK